MLGDRGSEEQIARMRTQMGLDRPLPVQYARYLWGLLHLDMGTSIRTRRPVLEDLGDYFPATFELATCALLISLALGIPLGVISALKRDGPVDHGARVVALLGVSMPVFWLALLLLGLFYGRWDLLPPGGRLSDFTLPPRRITGLMLVDSMMALDPHAFIDAARHLVLPSVCLAFLTTATLARSVRSQMLEVLGRDYVRMAHSLGLEHWRVVCVYALKNALLPVVTLIGLAYGSLLSGAVLTETVFSWPGIGKYAVDSSVSLDFPALMGVTLLIATVYSLVNLAVDLVYIAVDPRVRDGLVGGGDP
ncbi:MAG: ABC transporter permease [Proteobacteria bacterium]|nr:ABC transporter permease [Pseudomonadota bacterium]